MAIYIAHAAADVGVAKSLAAFLKGQSLPVRLVDAGRMAQASKLADNMILLWSRNMAAAFSANRRSSDALSGQSPILVDLDGAAAPMTTTSVVDAKSSGLRQTRAWRTVFALAKGRKPIEQTAATVNRVSHTGAPTVDEAAVKSVETSSEKTQYGVSYAFMFLLMAIMSGLSIVLAPDLLATLF